MLYGWMLWFWGVIRQQIMPGTRPVPVHNQRSQAPLCLTSTSRFASRLLHFRVQSGGRSATPIG